MLDRTFALIDRFVAARPRSIVIVAILLTIAATTTAPLLRFDSSFDRFLIPDSPDLTAYHDFADRFGNDRVLVVGIDCDDPLAPATVAELRRVVAGLEEIEGVERVYSLVSAPMVRGTADTLRLAPPVDGPPPTGAAATALLARLDADPVYAGRLVSRDHHLLGVLATLDPPPGETEAYRRITAAARAVLAPLGDRAHLSGEPVIESEMNRFMRRDLETFIPITLTLTAATLLFLFRTALGVVLPMAAIAASTVWALAIFLLSGRTVNNVSSMIPPLIMVIAASDAVHLFSHYRSRAHLLGRTKAISETVRRIGPGCLMTSLTTAAGFASLTASPIPALDDFGRFSALGVLFSFCLTIIALPAALHLLPVPHPPRTAVQRDGWPLSLAHRLTAAPGWLLVASLAIFLLAVAAIPQIRVETNDLTYFKKGSAIRTDTALLQHHLGGVRPLDIVLTGAPGAFTDPERLARLARFGQWVRTVEGIDGATSPADLLTALFRQLDGKPIGDHTRPAVAQGYLFFELSEEGSDELARYLSGDRAIAHIALQEGESRTSKMKVQIAQIRARLAHDFPELNIEITGYAHFYMQISDLIVRSQIRSLAIALVSVTAMMILLFRSWRTGLLSMVPNIVPLACTFGLMGIARIPLNSATAMVASVALGLAVDDTIHFLNHLQQERQTTPSVAAALAPALRAVARPMVYTSVILGIGFGTLLFSRFVPSFYFGLLATVTVVTALLGDLFLLPALLLTLERRRG